MGGLQRWFGRLPKLAREALIALAFVAAGGAAATCLAMAFGEWRLSMVFLLPVLFAGVAGGTRTALIAAVLAYGAYNFFLVPPIFSVTIETAEDALTLAGFVVVGLVAGAASRALRDEQARAFSRARILAAIAESNRFFLSTLDEAAVRARLAETISEIVGEGAAVTGVGDGPEFRAGGAEHWRGPLDEQVKQLTREAPVAGGRTFSLGRLRVRAAGMNERVFGVAVWLQPEGGSAYVAELDCHVGMLVELANAAIVRCRRAEGGRGKLAVVSGGAVA